MDKRNQDEVVSRWQDSQYFFELIRSYGPGFRLVGVIKRLDPLAKAAVEKANFSTTRKLLKRERQMMDR